MSRLITPRFQIRDIDLQCLNSLTKYPSIPTYHPIGDKGRIQEAAPLSFSDEVVGTEKIDGTSARIVVGPDESCLIGSREEFLYGIHTPPGRVGPYLDLVGNPAMGIVAGLTQLAKRLIDSYRDDGVVLTWYGEFYGGRVGAGARNYSGDPAVCGFRLFDIALVHEPMALLTRTPAQIAQWRDSVGPEFLPVAEMHDLARVFKVKLVPELFRCDGATLPRDLAGAAALVRAHPTSRADLGGGALRSEGIVIRSAHRRDIAKLRAEDYARAGV